MAPAKKLLALLAILCTTAGISNAQPPAGGPFLSFGQTRHGVGTFRLGVRRTLSGVAARTDIGYLSGYVEGALLYWSLDEETTYGATIAPVVAYYFGSDSSRIRPYVGGGIGLAYVSETRIGSRDLATNFQFEDRIGLGVQSGRLDAFLGVVHYSNGSIKPPNEGLDAIMLTLAWSL